MKTRKNNRKRIVGGTNIRINTTTNTVNPSPPPSPSNILNISPIRRTPRRISNTAKSTKEILSITAKNVNQSGKKLNKDTSVYNIALNEIKWIMDSLPFFGSEPDKKTMESIRKDIEVLQALSYMPINNTKKDNIKPIMDHIGYLLEKLTSLNKQMQPIVNEKIGSNLNVLNRATLFKKVGEHIVRMLAFSTKYTQLFSKMRDQLQAFRNK